MSVKLTEGIIYLGKICSFWSCEKKTFDSFRDVFNSSSNGSGSTKWVGFNVFVPSWYAHPLLSNF